MTTRPPKVIVQIGGTLASVGQRFIDATSKMMIRMFFDRFSRAAAASATA